MSILPSGWKPQHAVVLGFLGCIGWKIAEYVVTFALQALR